MESWLFGHLSQHTAVTETRTMRPRTGGMRPTDSQAYPSHAAMQIVPHAAPQKALQHAQHASAMATPSHTPLKESTSTTTSGVSAFNMCAQILCMRSVFTGNVPRPEWRGPQRGVRC
eukprot:2882339-Prymnesium_polylepis.1